MKIKSILITAIAIILILSILYKISYVVNNEESLNKHTISQKEVEKTIKGIYRALIDKNAEQYAKYINSESLGHLNSNREEIQKSVSEYLKDNIIKEYKISSIEDFNENIKTVTTLYKEISKDGHETEHDDVLFLYRNPQTKTIEILYNGAVSSKSFEKVKVNEGAYQFSLNRTIELIDGVGVNITFENKSSSTISLGYGAIFANINLTTSDGEIYSLALNEVKLYKKNDIDTFDTFTYDTTDKIVKVEMQGIFELNNDGTPKEGSPKSIVLYEVD